MQVDLLQTEIHYPVASVGPSDIGRMEAILTWTMEAAGDGPIDVNK